MRISPLLVLSAAILSLSSAAPLRAADPAPAEFTYTVGAFSRDDTAAEKLGWHLATKAYTFRAITLFQTIDISKALGVKYFEVNPKQKMSPEKPAEVGPAMSPELRAEIKQKFADAGIKPMSMGVVNLGKDEATARGYFQFAKDLGIATLVAEPTPEMMDTVDKLCGEFGMRVAIHNHPLPSPYALPETELKAFEGHGDRIGSCSDVGHWTRSSLNAVECLHKLQGHIIQMHFKDVAPEGKSGKDVAWGTGVTDVKGMLEELHRQKFQGVFSMEYEAGKETLVDDLKKSITYFDEQARRIAAEK